MRGKSPEIELSSSERLKRRLLIADLVLLAAGIMIFTAGILFFGVVKFTIALAFLVIVAITFFSPKYGLYILYGAEGLYVLVFYINLMALAPSQIGLDYTISYYVEGSHLFIIPLVILFVSYLMGFLARLWLSGERYIIGAFEGSLLGFMLFCIAWTSLGIANEHYPLTILTDLHVVLMLAFAFFVGHSFKDIKEFKALFNFLIIVSLFHWIFLLGYFIQQRLYSELLFLLDLIRYIQGSSDIYSPYIPVMLAYIAIKERSGLQKIEKLYPLLIFLFIIRTVLCLSRGAMIRAAIGIVAVYFLLPKENRKEYKRILKQQFKYLAIFCILLFIASPNLASVGFKMVATRATETGKAGTITQGSLKYRALETQMVLESIAESPIFGYGPGKQTKKRMFTYTSASEEPYVHNGYLWYMLKFGAIGLCFLLYCLAGYFISVKRVVERAPPEIKAFLIGTFAAIAGIIPIVITNNVIGAVQGNIFVSFAFGVAMFAERTLRQGMRNGANREQSPS